MAILAECPWCHKKQPARNRIYSWSIIGVADLESWENHYGLNKLKKRQRKRIHQEGLEYQLLACKSCNVVIPE